MPQSPANKEIKMKKIILSTIFLTVLSVGTMSFAQDYKNQKPSTFFWEETVPSMPTAVLSHQQQERKYNANLASSITKTALASTPLAVAILLPIQKTAPVFSVLPGDMYVRGSLRRWMKDVGYQDVVWDLRNDIPTDRELSFDGDLNAALLGLMQALKAGPAPARACVHTNKVVRIIPATRFCEEPAL